VKEAPLCSLDAAHNVPELSRVETGFLGPAYTFIVKKKHQTKEKQLVR
jgi:hypothetical protein